MNLLDYTIQSGFLPHLKCENLAEAVAYLVATFAVTDDLVREVLRREYEGSTSVGCGLVIPHARFDQVSEVRIAVATLAEPIDLGADDGRPVDVVILLVGPIADPRQMLRVLARLARLVKQGSFLDGLRGAETAVSLRQAFALAEDTSA